MTQPRALYLADVLEGASEIADAAAAELRCLHAENLQLKKDCDGLLTIVKEWEDDAATWDNVNDQHDELLKALRDIAEFSLEQPTKTVARAAIAKAEENK